MLATVDLLGLGPGHNSVGTGFDQPQPWIPQFQVFVVVIDQNQITLAA